MNKRYIKLDQYGISLERYKELAAFTMQYREWKDALEHEENRDLEKKVSIVENTAEKCSLETVGDAGLTEYIIKNVTDERPYFYLKEIMHMPYRDKDFFLARKRFFLHLNVARK